MNDEQVTGLMTVLTEIRDELRLVRGEIVSSDNLYDPRQLQRKLEAAERSFESVRWFQRMETLSIEEREAELKALNL